MLQERWVALCERFGREGQACWRLMSSSHSSPDRVYHSLVHVEDCLDQLDRHRGRAEQVDSVEFAIWFHDLVYDTKESDNEERSAEVASRFLDGTSLRDVVASLILATKHHEQVLEGDAALICDIDLSILGRGGDEYLQYARAIRKEYHWVPEADYSRGRTALLERFLSRDQIFRLPEFRDLYEEKARANLQAEIDRLAANS